MKKSILWLASYPKSGNTWLRLFLTNYIVGAEQPVPINHLERYSTGDALATLYSKTAGKPIDTQDDTAVLQLRDRALSLIAGNGADVNLVKTHNKNRRVLGRRLIPPKMTRRAIYVVRDPLDMLVSYCDHYNLTPDVGAQQISDDNTVTLPEAKMVRQFLGSWSDHVESWTGAKQFPVTTIRYEDMLSDPTAVFTRVLKDIGAPADPARLERAIRFSSFGEASKQEAAQGFMEKSPTSKRFFRSGKAGTGRETLSDDVIAIVEQRHGEVMKKHGYLT